MNAFNTGSRLGVVAVLAGAVLLAGCASGGASLAKRGDGYRVRTDAAYVSTVEALARRRGVHVVWVNPPKIGSDTRQVK